MWNFIYGKLEQIVSWKIFAILIVLFIFCYLGFNWRQKMIENEMKKQATLFDGRWVFTPFDTRCWYTPREAYELLTDMGKDGRQIYAITQVTLDFLFPFVYGGLLTIIFFTIYGSPSYLLLIPIITVITDLLENITTAYLAWSYKEGAESSVTWFASIFTAGKSAGLYLSGTIILIGIVLFVWQRYK